MITRRGSSRPIAAFSAAVAAAMGLHSPEEASTIAQRAGFVSSGIPGSNVNAEIAAKLAIEVMNAP